MSLFKTYVVIPNYKMDNALACKHLDDATHEAEMVFGEEGKPITTDRDYPEGTVTLHLPFTVHRPPTGKVLAIRFYPGCYLVAREVKTTTAGVEVCLESYYSKSAGKDIALPRAIQKGTVLLVAHLSEFQLDLIDGPIIRLWEYYQYTIICTTARYRRAYKDREDDLMAESYMYFMRAIRRLQHGTASRENAPAFIASYLRDAAHNLLYADWFIKPVRTKDKVTGKETLQGDVTINSYEAPSNSDNDNDNSFGNLVSYDHAAETVPYYDSILYNFKQVSQDPIDNTILEMVYKHHTYEEIGKELGGITRAAVQQRIARIRRDYTLLITNIPVDIAPTQENIIITVERSEESASMYALNSLAWDAVRPNLAYMLGIVLPQLTDKEKREQKKLSPKIDLPLPVADRFFTPEERKLFPYGVIVKTFKYSQAITQLESQPCQQESNQL